MTTTKRAATKNERKIWKATGHHFPTRMQFLFSTGTFFPPVTRCFLSPPRKAVRINTSMQRKSKQKAITKKRVIQTPEKLSAPDETATKPPMNEAESMR